jgi:hypothetical protein
VPLRDLEEKRFMITRNDDDWNTISYRYPYNELPRLESHLQPKFVIFDAGSKLNKLLRVLKKREYQKITDNHPDIDLETVIMLYDAWTRELPDFALNDESYVDPNDISPPAREYGGGSSGDGGDDPEDRDYVANGTNSGRGDEARFRPRTRSIAAAEHDGNDDDAEHDDNGQDNQIESVRGDGLGLRRAGAKTRNTPTAKQDGSDHLAGTQKPIAAKQKAQAPAKKRKVFSDSSVHNQQLLSEATLSSFNRHFGVAPWTGDRIRQWSSFTKKRKVIPSIF